MKADHSSRSNTCGALRASFESRSATPPPVRCATSTQPSELQKRLLNQLASGRSCVIRLSFHRSDNFSRKLADQIGRVGRRQGGRSQQIKRLGTSTYISFPLEICLS